MAMEHNENGQLNRADALTAYGKLLDALPKPKRGPLFNEMCLVEATINEMSRVLNLVRGYYLMTMEAEAEQSPFVKMIDRIIPRQVEKAAAGPVPEPVPEPAQPAPGPEKKRKK